MPHTMAISVHAVAALGAAGAGFTALRTRRAVRWYVGLLAVSCVGLVTAVAAHFGTLGAGPRVVDLALVGLFVVVLARAVVAARVGPGAYRGGARYAGGVGFGLVSLADAFVVVGLLDLGVPWWGVAAGGAVVGVAGSLGVRRAVRIASGDVRGAGSWVQGNHDPIGSG